MDEPNHHSMDDPAPPRSNEQSCRTRPQRKAAIAAITNIKDKVAPTSRWTQAVVEEHQARQQKAAQRKEDQKLKASQRKEDQARQWKAAQQKEAAQQKIPEQRNNAKSVMRTKLQSIAGQSGRAQRGGGEQKCTTAGGRYVSKIATVANRAKMEGDGRRLKDGEIVKSNGGNNGGKLGGKPREFPNWEEAMVYLLTKNNGAKGAIKVLLDDREKAQKARMRVVAGGAGMFDLQQLRGGSSVPGGGRVLGREDDYEPNLNNNNNNNEEEEEEILENQQFSVSYYQGGVEGTGYESEQVTIYPKHSTLSELEALYNNCAHMGGLKMTTEKFARSPNHFWSLVYHCQKTFGTTRRTLDEMLRLMLPHLEWSHLLQRGRKRQESEKAKENKRQKGESVLPNIERDAVDIMSQLHNMTRFLHDPLKDVLCDAIRIVNIMFIKEVVLEEEEKKEEEKEEEEEEEESGEDGTSDGEEDEYEEEDEEEMKELLELYFDVDAKIDDCFNSIIKNDRNPIHWYAALMLLHGVLRSFISDEYHEQQSKKRLGSEYEEPDCDSEHCEDQNELSFNAAWNVAYEHSLDSSGLWDLSSVSCEVVMITASALIAWISSEATEAANNKKYEEWIGVSCKYNAELIGRVRNNWETLDHADNFGRRCAAVTNLIGGLQAKIMRTDIHGQEKGGKSKEVITGTNTHGQEPGGNPQEE